MKRSTILITALFLLAACQPTQTIHPENIKDGEYYKCRLEIFCTRSEGSIIKKSAFMAIETYFGHKP